MEMEEVNQDATSPSGCENETELKSIALFSTLPVYSISPELVLGYSYKDPVYHELYAEKHWTDVSVEIRCKYFADKIGEFRRRTGQKQRGRIFDKWDIIEPQRCNSVRIRNRDYQVVRDSYVYPESPFMIHDDPQGTEAKRLGLQSTKPVQELSTSAGMQKSSSEAGRVSFTSWWRRLKRRLKKKPKQTLYKDLALCELDEEALKKKYLRELKKRKSFPTVLTYRVPFLKAFRPKTEPENKYSPMEIPDEVFERYFRGQNPWDYGGSPLPFWTPPKV